MSQSKQSPWPVHKPKNASGHLPPRSGSKVDDCPAIARDSATQGGCGGGLERSKGLVTALLELREAVVAAPHKKLVVTTDVSNQKSRASLAFRSKSSPPSDEHCYERTTSTVRPVVVPGRHILPPGLLHLLRREPVIFVVIVVDVLLFVLIIILLVVLLILFVLIFILLLVPPRPD